MLSSMIHPTLIITSLDVITVQRYDHALSLGQKLITICFGILLDFIFCSFWGIDFTMFVKSLICDFHLTGCGLYLQGAFVRSLS